MCFTNTTGASRKVTVTDTSGKAVLNAVDIAPDGIPFALEFPLMPMLGIKWFADGAGLNGSIWGSK